MGDIYDMISAISGNNLRDKKKEDVDRIISGIITAMTKEAKKKRMYKVTMSSQTLEYKKEIMDFFIDEGFTIENYTPLYRNDRGEIIRYPSFEIHWE